MDLPTPSPSRRRTVTCVALGAFLAVAAGSHLTWSRREFQAQVPPWAPLDADAVVLASGVVEIALGRGLITARPPRRALVAGATAAFFVAGMTESCAAMKSHSPPTIASTHRTICPSILTQSPG